MVYRYKECVFFSICRLKTPQIPKLPFKPAVIHVKVPNMITCTAMGPDLSRGPGFQWSDVLHGVKVQRLFNDGA